MNDQKPVDEAVITYADFVRICHVEDRKDFGGFVVKLDGLYVKQWEDSLLDLLDDEELAKVSWHPTGRYDEPALPLPCSLPELRSFEDEAGLAGSIDEDLLAEVLAAKRKNHTEQPTRPAPAIKPASKAPPPPSHLRGSSPSWVGRPPAVRPSWEEWLMMDRVSIYEAAALSLDLEPRKLERDNRYSFPDEPTFEKYQMRARIIDDGDWSALGRNEFMVRLPAFAAWAIAKGMDIPAELRELAASGKVREQPASNAPGANHQAAPEVSTADGAEQAETSTQERSKTGEPPEIVRKRAALIEELQGIWPTIIGDLGDASRNGLSDTANSRHGFWKVRPALQWAFERRRIRRPKAEAVIRAEGDSEISVLLSFMLNEQKI